MKLTSDDLFGIAEGVKSVILKMLIEDGLLNEGDANLFSITHSVVISNNSSFKGLSNEFDDNRNNIYFIPVSSVDTSNISNVIDIRRTR